MTPPPESTPPATVAPVAWWVRNVDRRDDQGIVTFLVTEADSLRRDGYAVLPLYAADVPALMARIERAEAERDALEAHGTGDDRALHYDAICRTIGRDPCTDRAVDDIEDLFIEIKRHESTEDVYPEDTVARLARERNEAVKVADVATDAAAKAVLDAKEVYEGRHLKTIRDLRALLKEAGQVIALTTNTMYLAPSEPGLLARIDAALGREGA